MSSCVVLKCNFTVMLNVISGANKFLTNCFGGKKSEIKLKFIVPAVVGRYCATDRRVYEGLFPPELMLTGRICTLPAPPQQLKLDAHLNHQNP